jgi:hypothetical protein
MKNLLKHVILAGVATLALGSTALANSYTDIQNPNATIDPFHPYAGTFSIVNPGSSSYTIGAPYTSGTGTFTDAGGYVLGTPLSDATASFYFYDKAHGNYDYVSAILYAGFVPIQSASYDSSSGTWSEDLSIDGNALTLTWLEVTGGISYSVSDIGLGSAFTLQYALLQADTTTSSEVPDGGTTIALLGMGLLGVCAVSRKIRS